MNDVGKDTGQVLQGESPAPKHKLILVVDDEVDILNMFAMLLTVHGFRPITAPSAQEALIFLNTERPDVIVSDCMMPNMDGIAFCAAVRTLPLHQNTPFILMSAAPERHILAMLNYDAFLRKPFPFDLLREMLERFTRPTNSADRTI